jgi:cysteinyl-tRNA synthetase
MRAQLQAAYAQPTYEKAKAAFARLQRALRQCNASAAASLAEGLEETLTLHRLGLAAKLGASFKTTNCIESVNALIEQRTAKVDYWKTSDQQQRWVATALLDLEPRLRRVKGYRHLPALRRALQAQGNETERKRSRKRPSHITRSAAEFQLRMTLTPNATRQVKLRHCGAENIHGASPVSYSLFDSP